VFVEVSGIDLWWMPSLKVVQFSENQENVMVVKNV
jgi:hypothetical protein